MVQDTSKCDLLIILKPAMCDTTCEIPYCTQGKLITVAEIVHQSSCILSCRVIQPTTTTGLHGPTSRQSVGISLCHCILDVLYVTKQVHFNNEVFLELSNDENLLRKILLLTTGNFQEGSIDRIIMNNLIKYNLIINPSQTTLSQEVYTTSSAARPEASVI